MQASVLLLRPIAFRQQDTIRTEIPVCPTGAVHFALIPAVTPLQFPIVIVVKVSFPPLVKVGAIFSPDRVSRSGLLRQIGLGSMCLDGDDEPCTCYKNGIPLSEHPIIVTSADFVSCYKGRSYTLLEDETVLISDTESVATALPHNSGGASGSVAQCRTRGRNSGIQGPFALPH